jgi:ankyrin repeat protein
MANTKRSSRPRRHVTKKKHLRKKHTRKHLKKKQKSSGLRRSKIGGNSEDMKSAITNNDIDKVRYLIDQGQDVNQKITQFLIPKTLLTIAILEKNPDLVKLLIEKGANVNESDELNQTPLFVAVNTEQIEIVKLLIENGADVNHKDNNGETPLFAAIKKEYSNEMVNMLIMNGANVNETNDCGDTPLYVKASNDDSDSNILILMSLIDNGAIVNKTNKKGRTPLFSAVEKGNIGMTIFLINKGADVNKRDNNGLTPLFLAIHEDNNYFTIVNILIKYGANVNQEDKYGTTPLLLAVLKGYLSLANLLIEKGANVNQPDKNGLTPLIIGSYKNDLVTIRIFIENGANINQAMEDGTTPLLIAVVKGYLSLAERLLEKGANVNQSDELGTTPLFVAALQGDLNMARLLIKNGANINHKDNNNNTPLFIATDNNQLEMVKFLIELGANVNVVNKYNETVKDLAIKKNYDDIVKYIENLLILQQQQISKTGCQEGIPYSINFDSHKNGYNRIIMFRAHGMTIEDIFYLPYGVQYINLGLAGTCTYLPTNNNKFSILNDFIWKNQLNLFEPGPSGDKKKTKHPNGSNIPTLISRRFFRGGEGSHHTSFANEVSLIDIENIHIITNHFCLQQKCNDYKLTFYDKNDDSNKKLGWKEISGLKPEDISDDEFSKFNKLDTLDYGDTEANATKEAKEKMDYIRETYNERPFTHSIKVSDIVKAFEGTNTLLLFHACRTGLEEVDTQVQRQQSEMTPPLIKTHTKSRFTPSSGENKSSIPPEKEEPSRLSSFLPDLNFLFYG